MPLPQPGKKGAIATDAKVTEARASAAGQDQGTAGSEIFTG